MENWKSIGVFLTGFAATITAVTALITYINEGRLFEVDKPVEQIQQQPIQIATVDDPDGWVNVRELPSTSSATLTKLPNREKVSILNKEGNWYKVRTSKELIGYVYFDRLELIYNDHLIIKNKI